MSQRVVQHSRLCGVNFWHPLLFGLDWMDPQWLLDHYGTAFFWVSLAIVVVECGLFFPILPGDSLLFAIGLFVASGALEITGRGEVVDIVVVLLSFITAALLGNVMGYEIGRKLGPPILRHEGRIIKKEYFVKSHEFFEKHGAPALIIGRFVPIVRTGVVGLLGHPGGLFPRHGLPLAGRQDRHRDHPHRRPVPGAGSHRMVAAPS